jgi:hypothetical protein
VRREAQRSIPARSALKNDALAAASGSRAAPTEIGRPRAASNDEQLRELSPYLVLIADRRNGLVGEPAAAVTSVKRASLMTLA